ncbi:MAG: P-type conjugative transfer protein TrbL [Desulfovibrio sp.]|uniref:P-type conjugative transfer protein TrbL n=1 Tax=Desulfovibrio sp. TaxID=885 RepID=UPI0025C11993|nr:P-type conjugative transfer protein TrbL [Desulfovibrio sp.]MBS6828343.1 P-type conjugative transfer protein TrbL [Desulfovibrio sp.]
MSKINAKKILFIMFILLAVSILFSDIAFAVDSDIINKIVKSFADKTEKWTEVAKKYAKNLFYWCAVLEIAWLGIKMSLGGADIRETFKNFCITVMTCGFFLAVINNYHEWSRQVIRGLLAISGEMGNIQNASDNAFKLGLDLCIQIYEVIEDISIMSQAAILLGMLAALFIVIICFCQITAQVIFIKCEAYVAMLAACILVGFGASSFMRDYAMNVLRYILAVAFKLFVMQLVIGIGYSFMKEAITPKADFYTVCIIIGVAIVLYALVKQLPDTVAGIIQGSHVSSGQALTSTVMAMGAGMMGAGMAMGSGVANVGRAALAAKAQGAEGVGGMVRGTASNLWNATREAGHNKGERKGSVASSLRARIESARTEAAKSQDKKD